MAVLALPLLLLLCTVASFQEGSAHKVSPERMVFQTDFGDLHMAFYHEVAPVSAAHIRRLGELGGYNTNHFFRVDKGFVAQTADVPGGRAFPLNARQHAQAELTVPLEVRPDAKHDKRGILSMARHSDPNSGGSSFSVLLGPAPHLDMQYTVFGEVTAGLATLTAMEGVETTREGIFVMPKERITIHSTYMYLAGSGADPGAEAEQLYLIEELAALQQRYDAQAMLLQKERQRRLPGN